MPSAFLRPCVLDVGEFQTPPLRQLAAAPGKSVKRSISCIFLWMRGGPSHIDTFDPKPEGSADIKGEYGAIQTSVPGIQVSGGLA